MTWCEPYSSLSTSCRRHFKKFLGDLDESWNYLWESYTFSNICCLLASSNMLNLFNKMVKSFGDVSELLLTSTFTDTFCSPHPQDASYYPFCLWCYSKWVWCDNVGLLEMFPLWKLLKNISACWVFMKQDIHVLWKAIYQIFLFCTHEYLSFFI